MLSAYNGRIDGIFYCPHGPDENCDCRKPKPGLLKAIQSRLDVSLEGIPVIGDSLRDLESARAVGAQPILVKTGKGMRTLTKQDGLEDVPVFNDLADFVDNFLNNDR